MDKPKKAEVFRLAEGRKKGASIMTKEMVDQEMAEFDRVFYREIKSPVYDIDTENVGEPWTLEVLSAGHKMFEGMTREGGAERCREFFEPFMASSGGASE